MVQKRYRQIQQSVTAVAECSFVWCGSEERTDTVSEGYNGGRSTEKRHCDGRRTEGHTRTPHRQERVSLSIHDKGTDFILGGVFIALDLLLKLLRTQRDKGIIIAFPKVFIRARIDILVLRKCKINRGNKSYIIIIELSDYEGISPERCRINYVLPQLYFNHTEFNIKFIISKATVTAVCKQY